MPFHGVHQRGKQRLEALAADPVRHLPQHNQSLAHSIVVKPPARPRCPRGLGIRAAAQQTHRMLAVKARDRHELVQEPRLLLAAAHAIPPRKSFNKFIARRHAHLPHSSRPRCIRFGTISDEATIRSKGTIQARQYGSHPHCRAIPAGVRRRQAEAQRTKIDRLAASWLIRNSTVTTLGKRTELSLNWATSNSRTHLRNLHEDRRSNVF